MALQELALGDELGDKFDQPNLSSDKFGKRNYRFLYRSLYNTLVKGEYLPPPPWLG